MKNSIIADFLRVQKKKSYILMLSVQCVCLILFAIIGLSVDVDTQGVDKFSFFVSAGLSLSPLMVGIPIFLGVYSDDFRSRAMQTAIGFGLSRDKLILVRFIEILLLLAEAYIAQSIVEIATGYICGVDSSIIWELCGSFWQSAASTICCMAICMLFVYAMQSATFALVAYILFVLDILSLPIETISNMVPFLSENNVHLSYMFPTQLVSKLAVNEEYNYRWAIWILLLVVYIILPLFLTTRLFRKKELEF